MSDLAYVINHSIMITSFVLVMMLIIDYVNVLTKGKMEKTVKGGGRGRQYTITSFLGATPGCLGAFMNVSFYVHGLIGFGAIVGGMIATSGDEAFVMLALFPKEALILFFILFVLGIIGGWISDKAADRFRMIPCKECNLQVVHEETCGCFDRTVLKRFPRLSSYRYGISLLLLVIIMGVVLGHIGPPIWNWLRVTIFFLLVIATFIILTVPDHYLEDHIWNHIVKKHLWRVFLWTFFALLFITIGLSYWNIEAFVKANMIWVLLICALVGLIPESGPHMVFVMMFASGLVPFSILLTSSIVQDGHGMLPLFSYSVKDALMIKIFNFIFAIIIGLPLLLLGF